MNKHVVRFVRHDLKGGVVLVCPHGGDRRAYAVQAYSTEVHAVPAVSMIGRQAAARMLRKARNPQVRNPWGV